MPTEQSACILCSRNCGIRVDVDVIRILDIHDSNTHPMSKGYLYQKATHLQHYQNNADRLSHPLKRMPDRTFARITWNEARERSIRHSLQRMRKTIGVILIVLETRHLLTKISLRHKIRTITTHTE